MFAKLLKQEWKATSGLLSILSLGTLGAGALGAVALQVVIGVTEKNTDDVSSMLGVLTMVSSMTLVAVFLTLGAYAIGSEILLLRRFYKNKFTDEGYLTFTLPVKSWQIFLSSLVNTLVWMAIICVVELIAMGILFGFGLGEQIREAYSEIGYMYSDLESIYAESGLIEALPWQLVYTLTAFVSGNTIILTCITLGATIAKKHKILAAIGIYYGVSMVKGVITTSLSVLNMAAASEPNSVVVMYPMEILLELLLIAGGFLLSTQLMKKKLNLP